MPAEPASITYDETKVAIIIPLYNDEANIARALESAVAQQPPEGISFEVLVSLTWLLGLAEVVRNGWT